MKIFISYAHVDEYRVREMVDILRDAGHNPWFDHSLIVGRPWEDQLLEAILACDRFLYALTPESVQSSWCKWEFAEAVQAGKPVVPVLIQANTPLDEVMERIQYADFSKGPTPRLVARLLRGIAEASIVSKEWVPRLPIPRDAEPERPTKPPNGERSVSLAQQFYLDAYQHYRAGELANAADCLSDCLKLKPNHDDAKALLRLVLEKSLQRLPTGESTNLVIKYASVIDFPMLSARILSGPFDWIEIPGRHGALKTDEPDVTLSIPTERYWIAKYPVTNVQFAKFIEAGGYQERKWWTDTGWQQRQKDDWTEPRYWQNSKWNGKVQPVVGVSWYEAVAFCLWLSEITGEKIMLPTEAQWQYAAQGNDGRAYTWGNNWDCSRCNNSVTPCDSTVTTPVTQHEGNGDSPFGVVDMAGNVWEWCLTDYNNNTNDVNSSANMRVLRGGAWRSILTDGLRCGYRDGNIPRARVHPSRGFRLTLS